MGELNRDTNNQIESSADRQIAANALLAGELKSTLISNQIATETALYNHTQQLDSTLSTGFSSVTRQVGEMGSAMNMGLAGLNRAVKISSDAICKKLDDINETLKNPLHTQARELYNRALQRYNKGFYEEAIKDLNEAIIKNETDPFAYFLLGQVYLFGMSEFSNVINLDASIEALKNAVKYITPDAKNHPEARLMAAEIWFYLGLAYHVKANDDLHNNNKADYEKKLGEAKTAYGKSWDYSNNMLESLYNLARSKVLSGDEDGAIIDLKTLIKKDHGYCIKAAAESDFDKVKGKLFDQLKKELYQNVKVSFDSIQSIKAEFKEPYYSDNLYQLIEKHLPNTFGKDTPPLDMLEATIHFPEILSLLKSEHSAYIKKCKEQEREQAKMKQREEQKRIEEQKRAEQEEIDRRKRLEHEKREEIEGKRKRFLRMLLGAVIGLAAGTAIGIVVFIIYHILKDDFGGGGVGFLLLIAYLVSVILFANLFHAIFNNFWGLLLGIVIGLAVDTASTLISYVLYQFDVSIVVTAGVPAIICASIGALIGRSEG